MEIFIDLKVQFFFESFYPWIYLSVFLFFFLFSKSSPVSYFFTISRPSFVLYLFLLSYIFSFPNFSEFLFLLIQFEKQLFFFRSFSLLLFHIFSPYSHKNFCRTPTRSLAQFGRPNFSSPLSKTLISIKISKCLSSFYYHIYIYIYIEIEWNEEWKRSLVTFHRGAVYDYRFAFRQQAWLGSLAFQVAKWRDDSQGRTFPRHALRVRGAKEGRKKSSL